jgi:hypothetical protein
MSNNLDEKVRPPSDKDTGPDDAEGYGTLPTDPDAGLSVEERAAIVSPRNTSGTALTIRIRIGNLCANST